MDQERDTYRAVPFKSLDAADRKEVERAARLGELHPDSMITTSAVFWARERIGTRAGFRSVVAMAAGAAINVIVFHNVPDGDGLFTFWRERRLAKRLLRVAEQRGFQPPTWALISSGPTVKIPVADLLNASARTSEANVERRRGRHAVKPFWR